MKEIINEKLDRFFAHTLIAVPVFITAMYLGWLLVSLITDVILVQYACKLAYALIVSLGFLWLRGDRMYSCGLKRRGIRNLVPCLAMLVVCLLKFIHPLAEFGITFDQLIYAAVLATEAGVFEEFLMRGLPLGNILWKKDSRKQFIGLAFYTSFFFGLMHIANLFKGGDIPGVVGQVFNATCVGVLFAAIYLRTGSIIPTIILHALWDASSFLDPVYIANKTMFPAPVIGENLLSKLPANVAEHMSVIAMIVAMVIGLAELVYALILLRKSKWEEIKANFTK